MITNDLDDKILDTAQSASDKVHGVFGVTASNQCKLLIVLAGGFNLADVVECLKKHEYSNAGMGVIATVVMVYAIFFGAYAQMGSLNGRTRNIKRILLRPQRLLVLTWVIGISVGNCIKLVNHQPSNISWYFEMYMIAMWLGIIFGCLDEQSGGIGKLREFFQSLGAGNRVPVKVIGSVVK